MPFCRVRAGANQTRIRFTSKRWRAFQQDGEALLGVFPQVFVPVALFLPECVQLVGDGHGRQDSHAHGIHRLRRRGHRDHLFANVSREVLNVAFVEVPANV